MRTRRLGTLTTPAIGLGCMGFSQAYGPADDGQSILTIRAALEHGVTLLDTAMSYGAGHNEELIGRALRGITHEALIATKFGIVRGPDGVGLDAHPDRVRSYCEASLQRLGVDVIDLFYLHRVDPAVPIAETVGAMAALVADGKVRHLGLSEVSPADFAAARAVHPIAAVELEWSLAWREPEDDIVPAARAGGAGIVAYSPLGRGLLTGALPAGPFGPGDFRAGDPRFAGEALKGNLAVVEGLRRKARAYGVSSGQLALAWLLARGDDVVPIPGTRSVERIVENAGAAEVELSGEDLAELDELVPRAAWSGDRRSFAAYGTVRTGA